MPWQLVPIWSLMYQYVIQELLIFTASIDINNMQICHLNILTDTHRFTVQTLAYLHTRPPRPGRAAAETATTTADGLISWQNNAAHTTSCQKNIPCALFNIAENVLGLHRSYIFPWCKNVIILHEILINETQNTVIECMRIIAAPTRPGSQMCHIPAALRGQRPWLSQSTGHSHLSSHKYP